MFVVVGRGWLGLVFGVSIMLDLWMDRFECVWMLVFWVVVLLLVLFLVLAECVVIEFFSVLLVVGGVVMY